MAKKLTIEKAKEIHEKEIMSINGVTGIAIGQEDKRPCIVVYVKKSGPEVLKLIPTKIEDFSVKVEETGEFVAL